MKHVGAIALCCYLLGVLSAFAEGNLNDSFPENFHQYQDWRQKHEVFAMYFPSDLENDGAREAIQSAHHTAISHFPETHPLHFLTYAGVAAASDNSQISIAYLEEGLQGLNNVARGPNNEKTDLHRAVETILNFELAHWKKQEQDGAYQMHFGKAMEFGYVSDEFELSLILQYMAAIAHLDRDFMFKDKVEEASLVAIQMGFGKHIPSFYSMRVLDITDRMLEGTLQQRRQEHSYARLAEGVARISDKEIDFTQEQEQLSVEVRLFRKLIRLAEHLTLLEKKSLALSTITFVGKMARELRISDELELARGFERLARLVAPHWKYRYSLYDIVSLDLDAVGEAHNLHTQFDWKDDYAAELFHVLITTRERRKDQGQSVGRIVEVLANLGMMKAMKSPKPATSDSHPAWERALQDLRSVESEASDERLILKRIRLELELAETRERRIVITRELKGLGFYKGPLSAADRYETLSLALESLDEIDPAISSLARALAGREQVFAIYPEQPPAVALKYLNTVLKMSQLLKQSGHSDRQARVMSLSYPSVKKLAEAYWFHHLVQNSVETFLKEYMEVEEDTDRLVESALFYGAVRENLGLSCRALFQ